MNIGAKITLRGGRIGEFVGLHGQYSMRISVGGEIKVVPRSLVEKTRAVAHKWPVGQVVTVDLCGETVQGEVVVAGSAGKGPRVKITDGHPVWHGAVVGSGDGKIRRVE